MKGLFRAFLITATIVGGLLSMKLMAEILRPNLRKYYLVDR